MNSVRRALAVEKLFPEGTVAFEIEGGASLEGLLPAEREYVTRAVEKRVREFAAGRLCARAAMAALGFPPAAILKGEDRAPIWPTGLTGSISHTDSYCVAVMAPTTQFDSLGVDVEDIQRMTSSIWRSILRPEELARLDSLDEQARQRMATIIFSAKEAFYKCQYTLTRSWLGFEDVLVDVGDGTIEFSVVNEARASRLLGKNRSGRFRIDGSLVTAGIAFTRD